MINDGASTASPPRWRTRLGTALNSEWRTRCRRPMFACKSPAVRAINALVPRHRQTTSLCSINWTQRRHRKSSGADVTRQGVDREPTMQRLIPMGDWCDLHRNQTSERPEASSLQLGRSGMFKGPWLPFHWCQSSHWGLDTRRLMGDEGDHALIVPQRLVLGLARDVAPRRTPFLRGQPFATRCRRGKVAAMEWPQSGLLRRTRSTATADRVGRSAQPAG